MTQSIYDEAARRVHGLGKDRDLTTLEGLELSATVAVLQKIFGPYMQAGVLCADRVDGTRFKKALLTEEEIAAAELLLSVKDRL